MKGRQRMRSVALVSERITWIWKGELAMVGTRDSGFSIVSTDSLLTAKCFAYMMLRAA